MCRACEHTAALADRQALLDRCTTALDAMPVQPFWRALSEIEKAYGDVERVQADMDAAEIGIAEAAAPVVRKMAEQLVDEAREVVKTGDMQALNTLAASYTAQLANVMRKEMAKAVDAGRRQILDQHRAQVGVQLAGARQDPAKAKAYLAAKANVLASRVSQAIVQAVVDAATRAIATGTQLADSATRQLVDAAVAADDGSALAGAILAGTRTLVAAARTAGRESVGVGRLLAFNEVEQDVASVHYTAILDGNVCENCQRMDGTEYPREQFGKAPNQDCLGARYGNECRCFEILIFKRDLDQGSYIPEGWSGNQPVVPEIPPAKPTTQRLTDAELNKKVAKVANRIRGKKIEEVHAWDDAGNLIDLPQRRTADSVSVAPEHLERLRNGRLMIHNHPGGTSFSQQDVYSAWQYNLAEIRVIGASGYDYTMLPPEGKTWREAFPDLRALKEAVYKHELNTRVQMQVAIAKGDIEVWEANLSHGHVLWTNAADDLGFRYERTGTLAADW